MNKNESILLIAFLSLLSFPVLYICRFLDNNTLTGWQWVFAGVSVPMIIGLLLAALVISYIVSSKVPPVRRSLVGLFSLSILAVIPLWSEPELLIDSGRYFLQAKYLSTYGFPRFIREWGGEIGAWTDLPLIPALYGLLFKVFGESRVVIQAFNTLLFALTVLLTSGIGRILWGRETGYYAGLLLLGMPYLLTQVPLLLVDIPTMFFLTLALFSFIRALKDGGGWLFF
ncbi:MAG: glycosyltransferase family 39 protein, partial [Thermodesulfobacteriota bacterium]